MKELFKKYLNKKFLKEFFLINLGVFLTALSFSIVQDPYNLVCGGVSGISILLKPLFDSLVPTSVIILVLNLICLILGLVIIGKDFFVKTLYGSLVFPFYTFLNDFICKPEDF